MKVKMKSVQIFSKKYKIKILKFLKVSSLLYPWLLYYTASMKKVVLRDWIFQVMETGQKLKWDNLMQIFKVFVMQLPDAIKYAKSNRNLLWITSCSPLWHKGPAIPSGDFKNITTIPRLPEFLSSFTYGVCCFFLPVWLSVIVSCDSQ